MSIMMKETKKYYDIEYFERNPNSMKRIEDFINSWNDAKHPDNHKVYTFFLTESGSMNDSGIEGSFSAPSITPNHKHFLNHVEPNVSKLVEILIKLGFITYTSCEGHLVNYSIHERHVGILDVDTTKKSIEILVGIASIDKRLALYKSKLLDSTSGNLWSTYEIYIKKIDDESWCSYKHNANKICDLVSREYVKFL